MSTSVVVTCTPVPTISDSDELAAAQLGLTKLVAETSGAAITGATADAIDAAVGNGGDPLTVSPGGFHFSFAGEPSPAGDALAALGYIAPSYDSSLLSPEPAQQWNAWVDVRGTGWNRASTDLAGGQVDVTAGIGHKLTPDVVAGIFAGFEYFNYRVPSLPADLRGVGAALGGYAGGTITDGLRWDATLAGSLLGYEATAGTATGSFSATRFLASGGLTGEYRLSEVILEPMGRVYALIENEAGYTDSLGTVHAPRSFMVGRASIGGKAIYPLTLGDDLAVSPYLGLYGDYYFSTDSAVPPVGQPDYWIGDGASVRITSGVSIATSNGASLGLRAELGGLRAGHMMASLSARVSGQF